MPLSHTKRPQRGAACMHKDKQPDFICSLLNGLNGSRGGGKLKERGYYIDSLSLALPLALPLSVSLWRIRNACAHNSFFTLDYNKTTATAAAQLAAGSGSWLWQRHGG